MKHFHFYNPYKTEVVIRVVAILTLFTLATVGCRADHLPGDYPVMAFIKSATSAWIFAIEPLGKPVQRHKLDDQARRQLIAILGAPDSYEDDQDLNFIIGGTDVGFEFRKNDQKVLLFCTNQFSYFWTTDYGHPGFIGILNDKARRRADEWKTKYAQKYLLIQDN